MSTIQEMFKIADIHAKRIEYALAGLSGIFPISKSKISSMSDTEFLLTELLVGRFAKLQDFIGAKLIDAFFKEKEESVDSLTMLDKLNKLERLEVIDDVEIWRKMREVRNHLAHEYPDHPEITMEYLNQLFNLAPQLLGILANIKKRSGARS